MGSGFGGMLFTLITGWVVDHYSYTPVFFGFGILPLICATILWMWLGPLEKSTWSRGMRDAIARNYEIIRPYIRRTPVIELDAADFGLPAAPLALKLEMMQHTGSFKARGAVTNLLTRAVPAAGVVAASGGNHGVAVAWAAMKTGKPGAHLRPRGRLPRQDRAHPRLRRRPRGHRRALQRRAAGQRSSGPPNPARCRSTPTNSTRRSWDRAASAWSSNSRRPGIDTPVGRLRRRRTDRRDRRVVSGTCARRRGGARRRADALSSARSGRPVDCEAGSIAADSLAPKQVGELMFPLAQKWVERVVLVEDEDIRAAQAALWSTLRIVAEPGGAAAFAALLEPPLHTRRRRTRRGPGLRRQHHCRQFLVPNDPALPHSRLQFRG